MTTIADTKLLPIETEYLKESITIAGVKVLMTASEYATLKAVNWLFNECELILLDEPCEDSTTILFSDLDTPTDKDDELNVCHCGDNGVYTGKKADKHYKNVYGVYFKTIVFLDGADTHFRTTKEDEDMKTIKATENKKNRTFTIRLYYNGVLGLKYRTLPMTQDEFDSCGHHTQVDWQNWLKCDAYYLVKSY